MRQTVKTIHLVGYASAGLGLGEILRRMAIALLPHADQLGIHDFRQHMDDRGLDRSLWSLLPERCFSRPIGPDDWVLYVVNPDQLADAIAQFPAQGRRCSMWFWELERLPRDWRQAFAWVDELWTPTTFIHQAVIDAAHELQWEGKVQAVPLPLYIGASYPMQRAFHLGWDLWDSFDSYRYYFSFDCHSVPERKNPYDLVKAFRIAFADIARQKTRQPCLLLRVLNPDRRPDCTIELERLVAGDPRIKLDHRYLSAQANLQLIQACDVYVSLHRSEGLGLGMAEAMSQAKACIATSWSGNLDFMMQVDENSPDYKLGVSQCLPTRTFGLLLKPKLCPIQAGEYPHSEGLHWAQVDLGDAASALRWCYDHPAQALTVGRSAAASMAKRFGPEVFRKWLFKYLET